MRSASCAALLGGCLSGCLIVHTDEDVVEDPCPAVAPLVLADANGPFVIRGDSIYFIGASGTLSRVAVNGGPVSELTTERVLASSMDADATDLYWGGAGTIIRKPFDSSPYPIAEGYEDISHVIVDDTSVVWASNGGLDRWSKADQTIEHLFDASPIFGLGASDGSYYFSDTRDNAVRKTPPTVTVAEARSPGPLVVDDQGVYFYDVADPFTDHGGAIRLVPREGGAVITTADRISLIHDMTSDEAHLYFPMVYGGVYRIKQVSRFGGEVRTLSCGSFVQLRMHIEVADFFVYWTDDRSLYRLPTTGFGGF